MKLSETTEKMKYVILSY